MKIKKSYLLLEKLLTENVSDSRDKLVRVEKLLEA